jgi:hypothetical protein
MNTDRDIENVVAGLFWGLLFGVGLTSLAVYWYVKTREKVNAFFAPKTEPVVRDVPQSTVVCRESGEVIRSGKYTPEPTDVVIPLDLRMISPYAPPNPAFGLAEPRYFSAFYTPDAANIHLFIRTLREASGGGTNDFSKLDLFLTLKCGSRLLIDPRPDCADIGAAYGVKFSGFIYPDTAPEPKDDRHRVMRYLENELGAVRARADMVGIIMTHISAAKRGDHEIFTTYPDLKTEEGIQLVVDVFQSFLERAKAAH